MMGRDLKRAALRGEPSYLWRAGQERRLRLIEQAAGERASGLVLDNGCGIGAYLSRLQPSANQGHGLEFDEQRARQAAEHVRNVVRAAGEALPYPVNTFDLILSHEVLEHVQDDAQAIAEMVRTLKPGGRLVLFAPNRGYPFETHGVFWRGHYHFGNFPLVNYLPTTLRNRLAPHVRIYTRRDLAARFEGLPVAFIEQRTIFGAYDNLIARWPKLGRVVRSFLQSLEGTAISRLGLSHFWVVEKQPAN